MKVIIWKFCANITINIDIVQILKIIFYYLAKNSGYRIFDLRFVTGINGKSFERYYFTFHGN